MTLKSSFNLLSAAGTLWWLLAATVTMTTIKSPCYASFADKWNIGDPTFEYHNLQLEMIYSISASMDASQILFTLYGGKKIHSHLFFRGGSENNVCLSDETFFEIMTETIPDKPRRLNNREVRELLSNGAKLTKEQRLLKSVIQEAKLSKAISEKKIQNIQEMHAFRRKYKNYLRLKRFVPLTLVAPLTSTELSKMAYAAAFGSKSISLTLPGLVGYSLPAFFFFHMSSFYAPDKLKPVCQVCKYTLGAPFWIVCLLTDGLMSAPEEMYFGEEVPIDVVGTGGTTIPGDRVR